MSIDLKAVHEVNELAMNERWSELSVLEIIEAYEAAKAPVLVDLEAGARVIGQKVYANQCSPEEAAKACAKAWGLKWK